jgi:hypothetical protein
MKVSYVEGVASHNGPESCGTAREGGVEALAGGRTGRVLSREIHALLRKQQVLPSTTNVSVCCPIFRTLERRQLQVSSLASGPEAPSESIPTLKVGHPDW